MKKTLLLTLIVLLISGIGIHAQEKKDAKKAKASGKQTEKKYKPVHLTSETFKEKIFDYTTETEWKYKGDKPCVIDFYADWCRPCKMIAPILEDLSEEFKGEVLVYKVDTQHNREVAQAFGITSIPRVLFVPLEGQPYMVTGARGKEFYKAQMEKLRDSAKKKTNQKETSSEKK